MVLPRIVFDAERVGDLSEPVGEEWEREVVLRPELLVRVRAIDGDADDVHVLGEGEPFGIPEPTELFGADETEVEWIERNDECALMGELGKFELVDAVLTDAGQFEVRHLLAHCLRRCRTRRICSRASFVRGHAEPPVCWAVN